MHEQDNTNLCGIYCERTVEDFKIGIEKGPGVINVAAKRVACSINGNDNWNRGIYPTNCAVYGPNGYPIIATDIDSIEALNSI